jgi:hypothetical protein
MSLDMPALRLDYRAFFDLLGWMTETVLPGVSPSSTSAPCASRRPIFTTPRFARLLSTMNARYREQGRMELQEDEEVIER